MESRCADINTDIKGIKLIVDLDELMEVIRALEPEEVFDHDIPAMQGADLLRGIISSSPEYFPPTQLSQVYG